MRHEMVCWTLVASLVIAMCTGTSILAQQEPLETLDDMKWAVGTWVGDTVLREAVPGLGPKGTPVKQRATWKFDMDGKFFVGDVSLEANGKSTKMLHIVYGVDSISGEVREWLFHKSGLVAEAEVRADGGTTLYLHHKTKVKAPEQLAKETGEEVVSLSWTVKLVKKDDNTFTEQLTNQKYGALSPPDLPATTMRRVEEAD